MTQNNIDRQRTMTFEHNLTVALRIRPISEDEIIQGATPIAHKVDKNMVVLMDPFDDPDDILRVNRSREKQYVFDVTFDGNTTQDEVYQHTSSFLIPNVINGYNATVFAYGATGAGKTHTMLGTETDPGIMARALNELFQEMETTKDDMTYTVTMSYLEIYNEMIRDLLNPSTGYLELREDSKGVQVAGLVEVSTTSTREVIDLLTTGNKERTQEPTAANKTSSRSHAILQVTVKQRNKVRNIMQEVRVGKLFLIDLAGSERAAATHNRGKRMVEGAHINRSLLALGNCINALSDKNGSKYVNFRDSKLTRLLKDALGGNCKTVMIAHISPASIHFEESRNTLVYADRAKHIKTKVRKNVVDVTYHIAQYTNIIAELREEIGRLRLKLDEQSGSKNAAVISAIQSEVMQSRSDLSEMSRLREQLLDVFRNQMELRRSIMEFNNTAIEISLETTRNQLLVQKWEREKILHKNRRDDDTEDGDKDGDTEKQRDLEGSGSDDIPEPEEVRVARDELIMLRDEREKTEKLKAKVQKELDVAKKRAAHIEETLPRKVNSEEQKEILQLMCKVHELEIENMEMQSACLLWNFDSRRKDMVISKQFQHHQLCDEIIAQQRTLLDTHQVACPKDLDELYELYQQETEQRVIQHLTTLPPIDNKMGSMITLNRRLLESDSSSDMDKLSALDADNASLLSARFFPGSGLKKSLLKRSTNNMASLNEADNNNNNKIFSQSPKSQQIREAARKEALAEQMQQGQVSNSSLAQVTASTQRQQSIITLSSRSTTTTPTPVLDIKPPEGRASRDDKATIASNTRNIAALAAKRKNKAQLNAYNTEKRNDENYLSASRLAHHDKKYGSNLAIRHLLDPDAYSNGTGEHSILNDTTGRSMNTGRNKVKYPKRGQANKRNRTRTYDVNYQHLNQAAARRQADQMSVASGMKHRNNTKLPQPNTTRSIVPRKYFEEDRIREFSTVDTPPVHVQQTAPDRGRGLTVQRKLRGPTNEPSLTHRAGRRPPPTIPAYRRGDISVTGMSLQK